MKAMPALSGQDDRKLIMPGEMHDATWGDDEPPPQTSPCSILSAVSKQQTWKAVEAHKTPLNISGLFIDRDEERKQVDR